MVSILELHLGHRIEQGIPLLLSSLLTGRELWRILHNITLSLGIIWRAHSFFHAFVSELQLGTIE